MLALKIEKMTILKEMKHKWEVFKKKRTQKHFEKLPSQGFITMQQREGMIDKIFEILENGIEEV